MAAFQIMPLKVALSGFASTGLITVTGEPMLVQPVCPTAASRRCWSIRRSMRRQPPPQLPRLDAQAVAFNRARPPLLHPPAVMFVVAQGITSTGGMDWLVTKVRAHPCVTSAR